MKYYILLILSIVQLCAFAQKNSLSGYIKDSESGEELIGANIFVKELSVGTVTNPYGFYSLTVNKGTYRVKFSYMGYYTKDTVINLTSNQSINIYLQSTDLKLGEIAVIGEAADKNIRAVEMSTTKLQMKTIKNIPMILGEVDVIKTIQMLPGVSNAGEGTTGFYVRGGSVDQNLILLDEAPVYNAAHAGGIFSVFNGDVVKEVQLYKGGISSQYGGRLSSVLDIRTKDGNMREFAGSGGIGLLSSRLAIEGPIVKDRSSFVISGRRTYADLFFPLAKDTLIHDVVLYFHDMNAKLNWIVNDRNRIFVSSYLGRDVIRPSADFQMTYGNITNTVRWNHLFSERIFSNFSFVFSNFDYNLGVPEGEMAFNWKSNIIDYTLKADFNFMINPKVNIKAGVQSTFHTFKPGKVETAEGSLFNFPDMNNNHALEHAVYGEVEHTISQNLTMNYGLRFSAFQNIGEGILYRYNSEYVMIDSTSYPFGKIYNTYTNFEPRWSMRYVIDDHSSIKAGYNRMAQYIHLATNTASPTPMDIWFASSPNIKPQLADQIAVGYFRNFFDNIIETSVEVYYKKMYNTIDFKDHAMLLLNEHLEAEMRIGSSYAYGIELLVRKESGKISGWISYTLAKTKRLIPEINNGNEFSAPYDKPHDLAIVLSYDVTDRINFSGNWVYNSPQPRTMPTGRFEYNGMVVPVYSERNTIRLFPYHRLDLSLTIKGRGISKRPDATGVLKKFQSSWNFSVYNVYARKNPYSINFRQVEGTNQTRAEILYLFKALPSITYNFSF